MIIDLEHYNVTVLVEYEDGFFRIVDILDQDYSGTVSVGDDIGGTLTETERNRIINGKT